MMDSKARSKAELRGLVNEMDGVAPPTDSRIGSRTDEDGGVAGFEMEQVRLSLVTLCLSEKAAIYFERRRK